MERPAITRCVSPVFVPHAQHRPSTPGGNFALNGRVHLITSDLWETITGEKLSGEDLCCVLDTALPNSVEPTSIIQTQQQQYVLMSKDPNKSRELQEKIQECSQAERAVIFDALAPLLHELVFDQFANFAIQKLCEDATPEQQQIFLKFFLSDINNIVEHSIACRVLQKFIECTNTANVDKLFVALKPNIMDLCFSQNGNHIVQRFVIALPDRLQDIIKSILPNVIPLAIDNCGCRIVQRLFEQYKSTQLAPIVQEVLKHAVDLATNQYGNYVIQYILQSDCREYVSALLKAFKGKFYQFSIHKFASNVIEKCIRGATEEERQELFSEIIGTKGRFNNARILSMVEDQFGNYVIQRIIEFGTQEQQNAVYDVVYDNYDILYQTQYARHVLTRLSHIGYNF